MSSRAWDLWEGLPSKEEVEEFFWIFPDKGIILWKQAHGTAKALDQAGTIDAEGYRVITLHGRKLRAHHLMWFHCKGYWPAPGFEVDHRDRDRDNNKRRNIRIVDHRTNLMNRDVLRGADGQWHSSDASDY